MALSYEFNSFKDTEITIFDITSGETGNLDFVIFELEITHSLGTRKVQNHAFSFEKIQSSLNLN